MGINTFFLVETTLPETSNIAPEECCFNSTSFFLLGQKTYFLAVNLFLGFSISVTSAYSAEKWRPEINNLVQDIGYRWAVEVCSVVMWIVWVSWIFLGEHNFIGKLFGGFPLKLSSVLQLVACGGIQINSYKRTTFTHPAFITMDFLDFQMVKLHITIHHVWSFKSLAACRTSIWTHLLPGSC